MPGNIQGCNVIRLMRTLFLLVLGGLAGVVATVLFVTIDPSFDADGEEAHGGGNATIALDQYALATIIAAAIPALPAFAKDPAASVDVREDGRIDLALTASQGAETVRATMTVDPNIAGGRLKVDVVEADTAGLARPEEIAATLEGPLTLRLDSLAAARPYSLVAIRTTELRLILEIAF